MMSAGSPRRSHSQTRSTQGCTTVSPQPVTDPTILDSVAGFINEVATYNVPLDTKDQIQWAKFEQLDSEAVLENLEGDKFLPAALILVLGYTTGIQVWAIPANGEAVELLSWRHGSVRVLRFLPSPYVVGRGSLPDIFAAKRPLMALCDTTTPGPHHCALSFLSLKTGEQVKVIKFKNAILDVLTNRRSVVVTFSERIAIFDAFTLEDRLTVTTCYLSPGIQPNPVALGSRWMAYAEKKLISNKRSSGGNEGEGVQSYTATVLHAAKSLGKGLRELGETVASSLTGNPSFKPGSSPGSSQTMGNTPSDTLQKGVVTILDIENQVMDDKTLQTEGVVAHFAAHSEAIVYLSFDPSGLLLLTADKRGHDFHLFRIHPHPGGPALAAVHHLYILHRGDTTARVQDVCFSPDSRWVGVSTLRGTTHVFPITPYGGNVGVRTHATPHVVNRMSRFHRSAGLPVEGRSNSPVSLFEAPVNSNLPYNNPRLPPYPHPTIVNPLAQIRQPLFIQTGVSGQQRPHTGRPRLNSSSEDSIQVALRLSCCFAPARAWFDNVTQTHDASLSKQQAKPVESLFIMSCHGTLLQYDLDPHHVASVQKEKVCDETPIELTVHAKAEWVLQRQMHLNDVPLPVSPQNLNLLPQDVPSYKTAKPSHRDDRWLSQVEIVTHAGPHRRLWMGPQFTFKTYATTTGSPLSLTEAQTIDVGRSKPVNMPVSTTYPILIESGSASSCEQSPKLLDTYQRLSEEVGGAGELQLKEDLADAMLESPGVRESETVKPKPVEKPKDEPENGKRIKPKIQDSETIEYSKIKCDPVVPQVETKTKAQTRSSKSESKYQSKCEIKIDMPAAKVEIAQPAPKIETAPPAPKVETVPPPPVTSKKSRNKSKGYAFSDRDSDEKSTLSIQEITKKVSEFSSRLTSDSKSMDDKPILKNLITTPDLMDRVDTFLTINKSKKQDKHRADEIFDFPAFSKNEEALKEEKFEDARDTAETSETYSSFKTETKSYKSSKYQGLEPDEIVFSSEEEKSSTKKPRKPKTKLGVRLSKGKDSLEKVEKDDGPSVEVTLPAPKKTWSSIVSAKPTEPEISLDDEEERRLILDLPELESVEHFTIELPKKSYSTVAKQHIFEIDPHEDVCDSSILLPEKIYKPSSADFNTLKIDAKSSDDEKQENGSSQAETTESDDSSKVVAMDTEEDSCQPEVSKSARQGTEKTVKRKSKKKKR